MVDYRLFKICPVVVFDVSSTSSSSSSSFLLSFSIILFYFEFDAGTFVGGEREGWLIVVEWLNG